VPYYNNVKHDRRTLTLAKTIKMPRRQPKKSSLSPLLSVTKLTAGSRDLRQLIAKAEQLSTFDEHFEHALPKPLRGHFKVNGLNNNQLTITATSASLATRCRMSQQQILATLNRQLDLKLSQIKIKIRPKSLTHPSPQTFRTLSTENAQILITEAEQTKDEKLKEMLMRLASHARQD
jgi:hypothetical protein